MYKVKILTYDEIPIAQRLLYNIYYKEQGWSPPANNSSYTRYINKRLRDDFEYQATWFGVYHYDTLIGTTRTIAGELEFTRYHTMDYNRNAVELNRTVVKKEYRNTLVLTLLMLAVYVHTVWHGYGGIYGTVSFRTILRASKDSWEYTGINFKYDQNDKDRSHVIYLPLSWYLIVKYLIGHIMRRFK